MATEADVQYHYDVDNDFFKLFLDKDYRVYSCAVWKEAATLEDAQLHKLQRIARYAHLKPGHRVMDIGCGWGGFLKYAAATVGARFCAGLTLSRDQFRYVSSLAIPAVAVELASWADYSVPEEGKFDALVSVGAFEHFASLQDRAAGRHRDIYAAFFDWCRSISTDDAHLALQTIVAARPPANLQEVKDARYVLDKVFPGSAVPSISDVQAAVTDRYEISACKRIGADYARTLRVWRQRLIDHQDVITEKYGAELYSHYDTYFLCSIRNFDAGVSDLLQISLKRVAKGRRR